MTKQDVFASRVASNCRRIRQRDKIDIERIARRLGTSTRNYYRIEEGTCGALAGRFLSRLCSVFDCEPEDLIKSRKKR
jgi:DNA-binding Xre family transcriptional regulator